MSKTTNGDITRAVVDTEDGEYVSRKPARRKLTSAKAQAAVAELADKTAGPNKPMVIPKLDIRMIRIKLVGDAPLIVHKFSEKAKKQMLDKQMGAATEGRAPKDPMQDFRESLYLMAEKGPKGEERYCFPSIAFKAAAVTACTSLGKAITKVQARQAFHVIGDMAEIVGTPTMREDTVRIGQGTTDLRYRGEFRKWSCELVLRYNARVLTDEQIINLFNVAGFAVGVGEWRPERDGQFGLFHVE